MDGPSSLTYSLSLASKEPSLSTAGTTSPLKALQLVKSEDTVAASPRVASEPDNVIEAPAPKALTPRKRSSRFNNILGQWKEKSEHNHNGHFLSPPSNDTAPNHSQTPPATTRMPLRRRSTGDYVPVENPKGETTLPGGLRSHSHSDESPSIFQASRFQTRLHRRQTRRQKTLQRL